MPASATLRPPDIVEIPPPPPNTASRGNRLQKFVTQRLAANRDQVSLIAWDAQTKTWKAWLDAPPPATPPDRRANYADALVQANVALGA